MHITSHPQDILPFNYTRVLLSEYPGVPGSDYINANYIKVRRYMPFLGPLEVVACFKLCLREQAEAMHTSRAKDLYRTLSMTGGGWSLNVKFR